MLETLKRATKALAYTLPICAVLVWLWPREGVWGLFAGILMLTVMGLPVALVFRAGRLFYKNFFFLAMAYPNPMIGIIGRPLAYAIAVLIIVHFGEGLDRSRSLGETLKYFLGTWVLASYLFGSMWVIYFNSFRIAKETIRHRKEFAARTAGWGGALKFFVQGSGGVAINPEVRKLVLYGTPVNVSGAEIQVAEYDLADVVRYGTVVGGSPASGGMIVAGDGMAGAYGTALHALNDDFMSSMSRAAETGITFETRDRKQWLVWAAEKSLPDWQRKLDLFFQDGVVPTT